ncbi:GAP family protein [Microbacterium soli]|uniref:GAP family protein n=1 Tax=Microbacterium soli TaxID=446075 RepID=A0ABP7N1I0_9MICO
MEMLLDGPLALVLAGLALLDGLSVGTLLIPLFLLLAPGRVRVGRILLYLASITVFYLVVGLLFLWGLVNIVGVATDVLDSTPGTYARLITGAAMLVGSFFIRPSKDRAAARTGAATAAGTERISDDPPSAPAPPPGRLTRWRDRMLDPATTPVSVVGLAIAAGLVEVATMLPYIVAMTMLADSAVSAPLRIAALVGYCLVMIAPALLLLVLRVVAHRAVERPLRRFAAWLGKDSAETTAWIVGIIGFFIAGGALSDLGGLQGVLGGALGG